MSNFNLDPGYDTGKLFEWAKDFYDAEGNRTKSNSIPVELEQTGLVIGEPWARVWHNQAMFNFSQYIKWLNGQYVEEKNELGVVTQVENFEPVGTVKMVAQSRDFTTANASTYWGGTWTRTAQTVGAIPVHMFQKTALATAP